MASFLGKARMALTLTGKVMNEAVSFVVFSVLDLLDLILCFIYRVVDFFIEAEWKPCYCCSSTKAITNSGKILFSEQGGESKILSLTKTKLHLDEISDTLYTRPSLLSEFSNLIVNEFRRLKVNDNNIKNIGTTTTTVHRSTFTINSTIVEMVQEKILEGQICHPIPRWSDCDCKLCTNWTCSSKDTLYLKAQVPSRGAAKEDVVFIHGFISSSAFWTETVFPNFSSAAKSRYRLFAIDLLGFGRSPKPTDSFYTLRDHLDMIEKSVIEAHKVKSFHIVAHSLGCILALALAVKYPNSVKSLTLLAPPYYPVPKGEQAAQYVMRRVAPRRVWPLIAFGASIACWYEHISRTVCLLICKNHQCLEFLIKLLTRNRIRTFLVEGFFCHTHNAAWHTLHNIICGTANKLDEYLDDVRDKLNCNVNVFHGKDDELIPVECSYHLQNKLPRARLKVFPQKDHITIVLGRQKPFAQDLEDIWRN